MKLTVFLILLVGTAHTTLAEPEPNFEDLPMYEEEKSLQAKQSNLDEMLASAANENLENDPEFSINDIYQRSVKEWSEQSFVRAIKSLGILKIPGIKLVKLPKSLIETMKRMPTHTIVRPHRYVQPESKFQYDVSQSQCKEVLQDMYTLAHSDRNLAFKVQTMKCQGSCFVSQVCILKKKTVMVYLIDQNKQFHPKTIEVGCSCGCV